MNFPNRPSTSLNIDVGSTPNSGSSIQTNPAIADIQTFLFNGALRSPGLTSNNLNTHKTTNMDFGWINIYRADNNPPYTFYGSTILTPSSTKAESFAILTAVLACPSQMFRFTQIP
ncbi:hypothetical protein RhiirA5_443197 [Rhizophagus irregularis]|uniref:Uncharacterized protein n=1 Tax=Rhizophagus irregularis TaxID=588596 RepID=A0A2N0NE82_9GLOM|nr:hypothetical protein RhiirA5_443197 [Rhizophagus irregularis]CAB4478778.1 unnamed protein product [Rhizophagus irregularis]